MNLLSIQSRVAYDHVGNAAATFPLQRIGVEVWPIHTVQFSNHTGYGAWTGRVFEASLIAELLDGIEARFRILQPALQIGELVIARILDRLFEGLEAAVAARLIGHLGDRLAGFFELAFEASDGAVDPIELHCRLGYEAITAKPRPLRDRGYSLALQHNKTLLNQNAAAADYL